MCSLPKHQLNKNRGSTLICLYATIETPISNINFHPHMNLLMQSPIYFSITPLTTKLMLEPDFHPLYIRFENPVHCPEDSQKQWVHEYPKPMPNSRHGSCWAGIFKSLHNRSQIIQDNHRGTWYSSEITSPLRTSSKDP